MPICARVEVMVESFMGVTGKPGAETKRSCGTMRALVANDKYLLRRMPGYV